ncbi:nitrate/nitrite transporter [Asticcacaulis sp. YBE204]|uniref:MFS transporter n=1 Tax=Asticcacaulis sp. YBE204 TaxID=1282363 RepID=UPI0003C3CE63|nr:MFS transporter [Asticcacaulis sp. YBE204]ESQ80398.1 MFS transporter [Asticcacaulis sp. YBE204]
MTIETRENRKTALGVVVACTIGNMVCLTATVSSVFGVFLVPISESFAWQRSQVTAVLGIISLVSIVAFPLVGRMMDKYGGRKVLLIGNILFALSVAAISQVNNNLLHFYLLFALIGVAGAIPCTAMFSKVVSEWFDKSRGLMLGISAGLGNGVGATFMPIVAALLLGAVGWQMSFAVIGFIIFAVGFPATFFLLKDAPRPVVEDPSPRAEKYQPNAPSAGLDGLTLSEALKTPVFWLIIASLGLGAGCLTAVFSHVIPVLTDRKIDMGLATTVMVVLALVTSVWQIVVGSLLDRIKSPRVTAPFFVIAAGGLWLLEAAQNTPMLLLAGALLGIGLGTAFGALPYYISRYFGLKAYGLITGVIYAVVMLAQGLTPFLMDVWFDHYKAYAGSILIIEACLVIVAALIMLFPPYRMTVSAAEVASVNHGGL